MNLWGLSRRVVLLLSLVVWFVGAVTVGPAGRVAAACTCQATSVAQGLAESQVAFTGELVEVSPGELLNTLSFTVDLVYKGEVTYQQAVATLPSADDCGVIDPRLGKWMVFATQFPDETGPLIVNTCGASAPLTAGDDLPVELINGVPPADTPVPPSTTRPPPVSIVGSLPADWRPAALTSGVALAAVGLVARLLAGRRRTVR